MDCTYSEFAMMLAEVEATVLIRFPLGTGSFSADDAVLS